MKSAISDVLIAGTQAGLQQGARIFSFRRHYPSMRKRCGPVAAGTTFARNGSLEVRLARNLQDIRRAQHLRYKIFYEEMSATPDATALITRRDEDSYDKMCDHLLVLDHGPSGGRNSRIPWGQKPQVVGTYRLLRQEIAEEYSGFYTQEEFDISALIARHGAGTRFLELGRSCVLKEFRTRPTIELLWQGIWSYLARHNLDAMIGCASLEGTDPSQHAEHLSFLHHFCAPPPEWQASAHPHQKVEMNMIPKEKIEPMRVLRSLPPLIRGYLRAGAYIGDGAVIDNQFGTTDVLIILPVTNIRQGHIDYMRKRERPANGRVAADQSI
jgi:L-ornithine Nalpha-acyltransferase